MDGSEKVQNYADVIYEWFLIGQRFLNGQQRRSSQQMQWTRLVNCLCLHLKGSFTNYVYKTRSVGGPKMSTFSQRSHHRKCQCRGLGSQNKPKSWLRSLWTTPNLEIMFFQGSGRRIKLMQTTWVPTYQPTYM